MNTPKVEYKNGNVVDALLDGEVDFIAHICNCRFTMGSGVAKEIKDRIPAAYNTYMRNDNVLGSIQIAEGVFNLLAQDSYGRDKRHLNYGALGQCLIWMDEELFDRRLNKDKSNPRWKIGIPYKMGSDRAGGDWEIVKEMIEHILCDHHIIYYKLGG